MLTIDVTYEENDFAEIFDFDYEKTANDVVNEILKEEQCPYEAEASLLLMSPEEIHEINMSERGIDRTTDVLSFPMVAYSAPSHFEDALLEKADAFDPETNRLMLGDILINVQKVKEQAEEYGHSRLREFAFLIAHSTLHLLGYDHMTEAEEKEMFSRQERALRTLGITREESES